MGEVSTKVVCVPKVRCGDDSSKLGRSDDINAHLKCKKNDGESTCCTDKIEAVCTAGDKKLPCVEGEVLNLVCTT